LPREDWDRIQEIFLEAVDLPPAERAAFLDRACNSNAEVRGEVESLLRADGTNEAVVFAAIESEAASMLDEPSLVGARLGPYRVLREIGRGGMGAVYLAQRDDEHYRKLVALKVVQRGLGTARVMARFCHERQILAGFEHPYIARLIDGGRGLLPRTQFGFGTPAAFVPAGMRSRFLCAPCPCSPSRPETQQHLG